MQVQQQIHVTTLYKPKIIKLSRRYQEPPTRLSSHHCNNNPTPSAEASTSSSSTGIPTSNSCKHVLGKTLILQPRSLAKQVFHTYNSSFLLNSLRHSSINRSVVCVSITAIPKLLLRFPLASQKTSTHCLQTRVPYPKLILSFKQLATQRYQPFTGLCIDLKLLLWFSLASQKTFVYCLQARTLRSE